MDRRVIKLYDEYTHAPLPRRVFLERLAALTGSVAAASALLPLLDNNYAQAAVVAADDPRLDISTITYPGKSGAVNAYVARPKGSDKRAGILAIHENRGLSPYNQDVARRLAVAGFVTVAPDMLTAVGGTPADEDKARELYSKVKPEDVLADQRSALAYLRERPDATGKLGVIGFCGGGGYTKQIAALEPDVTAGVAFYGPSPAPDLAKNTKAKILAHYASDDERVNATQPAYAAALKEAGASYTAYTYAGTQHAFHNDTGAARYNKEAAELAWQRTVAFFKETLG
jgi:carboxymethylenebutenolidase